MPCKKPIVGALYRPNPTRSTVNTKCIECIKQLKPDINIMVEVILPIDCMELSTSDIADLQSVDILLAEPQLISQLNLQYTLTNLKWMHIFYAGADTITRNIQTPPNFILTRNGGHFGTNMAQYVLGFILLNEIKFGAYKENQKTHFWARQPYRDMSSITVGIVGFGDIGREIARTVKTLNVIVWGLVRKEPESHCPFVDRLVTDLSELLSSCDYIVSILPSVPATDGFFDGDVLSHCKNKKSVFMNIGRGNVIKEDTILHALDKGWLGHAVLDAFEIEPLPVDSKLWSHPNVTVTPHVSARRIHEMEFAKNFVKNYEKFTEEKPLEYVVDWNKGY